MVPQQINKIHAFCLCFTKQLFLNYDIEFTALNVFSPVEKVKKLFNISICFKNAYYLLRNIKWQISLITINLVEIELLWNRVTAVWYISFHCKFQDRFEQQLMKVKNNVNPMKMLTIQVHILLSSATTFYCDWYERNYLLSLIIWRNSEVNDLKSDWLLVKMN